VDIATYIGDVTGPVSLEDVVADATRAKQAGIAGVWAAQALGWDSLTLLALVGAAVPGIRLGTAVVPTPQRHPLVLAAQALSVQAAVGGRLTLGIGAGVGMMIEGMFGLPRDRPAVRMREYLAALRPLLRGEPVEFQGETLTVVGQIQVPGAVAPQVLLAALGPQMLDVAGSLADGAATWMVGPNTLADHIVPRLRQSADAAGRVAPRVLAGVLVCVTEDEPGARARVASYFELAGHVPEYRSMLDREGASGPQDVAAIGDETTVARHLRLLADAGATEIAAAPFGTPEEKARTLALLGELAPGKKLQEPEPLSTSDRVAVHELVSLHGHLADDRRASELSLLLTEDAVYDLSAYGLETAHGLNAIQTLHEQRSGIQPIGHHVTNININDRQRDGEVTVRSKGLSVMADGTTGTCVYEDVVIRTAAGWRIAKRRIRPVAHA
jgi:F420-dependent oxidoreductase-like protein